MKVFVTCIFIHSVTKNIVYYQLTSGASNVELVPGLPVPDSHTHIQDLTLIWKQ